MVCTHSTGCCKEHEKGNRKEEGQPRSTLFLFLFFARHLFQGEIGRPVEYLEFYGF